MHPMFVKLFIENDADDLLDAEETRRRSARRSRRSRPAIVVTAAPRPSRQQTGAVTGALPRVETGPVTHS